MQSIEHSSLSTALVTNNSAVRTGAEDGVGDGRPTEVDDVLRVVQGHDPERAARVEVRLGDDDQTSVDEDGREVSAHGDADGQPGVGRERTAPGTRARLGEGGRDDTGQHEARLVARGRRVHPENHSVIGRCGNDERKIKRKKK